MALGTVSKHVKRRAIPIEFSDKARGVRLQKAMAAGGVAARRDCEQIIQEGRVTVNGKLVADLRRFRSLARRVDSLTATSTASRRCVDAIDANLKFGNGRKRTPRSHQHDVARVRVRVEEALAK